MSLPKDILPKIAKHVARESQPQFRRVNKQFSQFDVSSEICCSPPSGSELFDLFKLHLNGTLFSKAFGLLRFDFDNDTYILVDRRGDAEILLVEDGNETALTEQQALMYLKRWKLDYSDLNTWLTVHLVFSRRKVCFGKVHECFISFIRRNLRLPDSDDIVDVTEYLEDIGRILTEEKREQLIGEFDEYFGDGPDETIGSTIPDFMKWVDLWLSSIQPEDVDPGYIMY